MMSHNIASQMTNGRRTRGSRGSAMMEFAMVFTLFIGFLFAAFDFAYSIFVKATLHHAVREGVRFAITASLVPGFSYHDDSIREVVRRNSLTLLNNQTDLNKVKIDYYLPDGYGATANNSAGNIVVVRVDRYKTASPVGAVLRDPNPYIISVSATDKMEPFPGAPPTRSSPVVAGP